MNLPSEYEIKIINEKNWHQWVELPNYIVQKRNDHKISDALFSDLLRPELLIKYGGTWIDSTVLCTKMLDKSDIYVPNSISLLEADLFLFQYTRPGSNTFGGISNWFISAHSNNKILMAIRDLLMAYWRDYDCTLDYYIFHFFFEGVAYAYPTEISVMPFAYSQYSLVLLNHWNDTYEEDLWNSACAKTSFHKLSNRPSHQTITAKDNNYNMIIAKYKQ